MQFLRIGAVDVGEECPEIENTLNRETSVDPIFSQFWGHQTIKTSSIVLEVPL
jgi:hypothetical protein